MLTDRLGLSQRRAIVGQHRSTQRHRCNEPDADRELRARLRASPGPPALGLPRAHAVLVREGHVLNREKVQRLWREEGPTGAAEATQAAASRRVDHAGRSAAGRATSRLTATGRTIKILHVVDAFTRESPADVVDHSIDAELTTNALRDLVPVHRRRHQLRRPASPWQNPWVESHGGRTRDELPAVQQFDSLLEARVLDADWRIEYNTYRPHSAFAHAHACRVRRAVAINQPQLL